MTSTDPRGRHRAPSTPSTLSRIRAAVTARRTARSEHRAAKRAAWADLSRGAERDGYGSDVR